MKIILLKSALICCGICGQLQAAVFNGVYADTNNVILPGYTFNATNLTGTLTLGQLPTNVGLAAAAITGATNTVTTNTAALLTAATNTVTTNTAALLTAATNQVTTNLAAQLTAATNTVATNAAALLTAATNRVTTNLLAQINTASNNLVTLLGGGTNSDLPQLTSATNTVTTNTAALLTAATNQVTTNLTAQLNTATNSLTNFFTTRITAATNTVATNAAALLTAATNRVTTNLLAQINTASNNLVTLLGGGTNSDLPQLTNGTVAGLFASLSVNGTNYSQVSAAGTAGFGVDPITATWNGSNYQGSANFQLDPVGIRRRDFPENTLYTNVSAGFSGTYLPTYYAGGGWSGTITVNYVPAPQALRSARAFTAVLPANASSNLILLAVSMPSTNYSVSLTPQDAATAGAALQGRTWWIDTKTATDFTLHAAYATNAFNLNFDCTVTP